MKEFEFNVDTIKELMDKMAKTHLGLLEIKMGTVEIKIEGKQSATLVSPAVDTVPLAISAMEPAEEVTEESAEKPKIESATGNIVTSPIVGTFYSSPAPDKESFVKVGQNVKKGDVLFIIESMKLMNEVQSEYDGVVSQIYVKSGEGVEFGQPIMIIQ